jgi:hypothetical protein
MINITGGKESNKDGFISYQASTILTKTNNYNIASYVKSMFLLSIELINCQ